MWLEAWAKIEFRGEAITMDTYTVKMTNHSSETKRFPITMNGKSQGSEVKPILLKFWISRTICSLLITNFTVKIKAMIAVSTLTITIFCKPMTKAISCRNWSTTFKITTLFKTNQCARNLNCNWLRKKKIYIDTKISSMQWRLYSIPIIEWRMSRVSSVSGDSWHLRNRAGISQMRKLTSWSRVHRDETEGRVGKIRRNSLMNSCPQATSGETNWAMIWELQLKLPWTPTVNLYLIRTSSQTTRSPVTLK